MANVCTAARFVYRLITLEPIDEQLISSATSYFANAESPVDPALFRRWFTQLQQSIYQQPELLRIGESWRARMLGRPQFNVEEAEELLREFVAALQLGKLSAQGVVSGYSDRRAGGPFDYRMSRINQPAGWALMYTVNGQATFRNGIREVPINPGDAVLISPSAMFFLERSQQSLSWGHYWVSFQPLSNWRPYLEWPPFGPDAYLLSVPEEGRETVRAAFDALIDTSSGQTAYKTELEINLMEHVLLRLAKYLSPERGSVLDSRVRKAQRYIDERFDRDFTVQDVADHVHMSSSRLTSLFKEQTGLSVFGWRDEKRLTLAARLLRSSNITVAEVGRRIGIQDAAYFSRLFRRYVGSSPRSYRHGGRRIEAGT